MVDLCFVPSAGAYADFLVTTDDTATLRAKFTSLGARVLERPGHIVYLWNLPEGRTLLSGVGLLDDKLIVGPAALDEMPRRLSAGKFAVLDFKDDVTGIRTDLLGMLPIFFGENLVTNRLHLAALVKGQLDAAAALAVVHSENTFCQQFGVVRTPVAGVSLLLSHQHLRVGHQVQVINEGAEESYEVIAPGEYRLLIRRGVDEILGNVRAILDSGNHVVSALTGGRDSRMVLGALIALNRVRDVTFRTHDIGKDVDVATGLVKRFGGSYHGEVERSVNYVIQSLDQRQMARRSQLFGAYHMVKASQLWTVQLSPVPRSIQMDGGCGELYRDFYQTRFPKAQLGGYSREAVEEMLCQTGYWKSLWPHHMERIKAPYLETFEKLPGRTLSAKLDSHYLNFRNRFHFGVGITTPIDHYGIHPLLAPSLLRAARGLPPREKATGRVVFDATRELCEELAYLPYDKPWAEDFARSPYHSPSRFDGAALDLEPAQDLLQKPEPTTPPKKRPQSQKIDIREFSWAQVQRLTAELRASKGPFQYLMTDGLETRLRHAYEKNDASLPVWFSRLQAFSDYDSILDV